MSLPLHCDVIRPLSVQTWFVYFFVSLQSLSTNFASRYVQIMWSLEIAETHVGRSHSSAYGQCSADLTVRPHLALQLSLIAALGLKI